MSAADKLITVIGGLFKNEATYGAGGSVSAATDGIQLAYDDFEGAPVTYTEEYDGTRARYPGTVASARRFKPSKSVVSGVLPFYAKGAGVAYSASDVPNIHVLLLAAGFDGAVDTTPSSETWTYTPTPGITGFSSLFGELYARGEKWPFTHGYLDYEINADNPAPPKHMFNLIGLLGDRSDAAVPAITYPSLTLDPPQTDGIAMTIGTYTAIVESANFKMNRSHDNPRIDLSIAGGHTGFAPTGRNPQLTLVVEATNLVGSPYHTASGLDPYKLKELATELSVSCQWGSVQYNRYKVTLPQAQLVSVTPQAAGPIATWELVFEGHPSSPILDDDVSIVFD